MAFRLDRLSSQFPIAGKDGRPTQSYQRRDTNVLEQIEAQITDLANQLALIQAAQAAANAAQADATAAARESARINSYTVPTNVLSATDAGADASIAVAAHTRVYPVQGSVDVADVAISAGSITGLAFSTAYYVYYDDATLANTAPTFAAVTNPTTAQVGSAAGRHFVGKITTPADGAAATSGSGGSTPPGGGGGDELTSI